MSPVFWSFLPKTTFDIGTKTVLADSTVSTSRPSIFAASLNDRPTPIAARSAASLNFDELSSCSDTMPEKSKLT